MSNSNPFVKTQCASSDITNLVGDSLIPSRSYTVWGKRLTSWIYPPQPAFTLFSMCPSFGNASATWNTRSPHCICGRYQHNDLETCSDSG
ncbi:hypothetical protein PVK06_042696 [Gossypium arboreum]|uniref:Uncharacterized protein n=1 Tax=Gossypium arboreum TaxID=29729 RepID=A0ABR0MLH1_GOSAR|nr:hypothetical protein PVK06_042696 [Gossypium arboreum]